MKLPVQSIVALFTTVLIRNFDNAPNKIPKVQSIVKHIPM